jgi:hypothetical protein
MPTENQSSDSTTESSSETQEQQSQQESTEETSGQDQTQDDNQQQETTDSSSTEGDKPKPDPAKQALLADLSKERKEHKASKAKVTELEAKVAELSPRAETADAVQARYDRLEEFLQAVGGPLGRALDSKSFTTALFETDQDIDDIVKKWHKDNPSATTTALGSSAAKPAKSKADMNTALRAAASGLSGGGSK